MWSCMVAVSVKQSSVNIIAFPQKLLTSPDRLDDAKASSQVLRALLWSFRGAAAWS